MPPTHHVYVQHPPVNGMALTGFIISLVGFLTCGLLSPIGLLFSFIGLFQQPKGFAIAGVALGVIGSWWLWAFGLVMLAGMTGLAGMAGAAKSRPPEAKQSIQRPRTIATPAEDMPPDELFAPDRFRDSPKDKPDPINVETPVTPTPEPTPQPEPSLNTPEPEKKPVSQFREFTSANGSFKVSARYIGMDGEKVQLRREDTGKVISVPIDQLSETDRDWIADRRKKK